jgi:4-carboxymuconolactone decarboxylase
VARIPPLERREQVVPAHRPVWDRIAQSRGRVAGPFAMLLHSPEVASRTAELGAYIRFASTLDPRDRELAILTVARELDCRYEWGGHVREARRAGVGEEAIAAIRDRKAPAGLTPAEAGIVAYARQLLRDHRVEPATFETLRGRLGVQGLVELTATVGYYGMIACTLNAFEVEPGSEDDRLPV